MLWREEYELGIPEIDRQHRELINALVDLETTTDKEQRWSAVHFALVRVEEFVNVHFAVEESLMRLVGFPNFDSHVAEHRAFRDKVAELKLRSLQTEITDDLRALVTDWLLQHIVTRDREYVDFIRGHNSLPLLK
ncbi:MAG TPA: bacteriohemerythrin [Rhodocyclaceae bacterium]